MLLLQCHQAAATQSLSNISYRPAAQAVSGLRTDKAQAPRAAFDNHTAGLLYGMYFVSMMVVSYNEKHSRAAKRIACNVQM